MKECRCCGVQFEVSNIEREFLDKLSPIFPSASLGTGNDVKYAIPEPTLCSTCRQKRRLGFRNERSLYRRKCDLTGRQIISIYNPEKDYKVYCNEAFFGDQWNAFDYGRDFDFTKTFTEQFDKLLHAVPHLSSVVVNSENCEYTSYCVDSKDCYMSQRLGNAERIYYTYLAIGNCLDCIDCMYVVSCELCFEALDCERCYACSFIQNCKNCSDSRYCFDCIGCKNCFGCVNLRNKEYHFFNEKLSKEEYEKKIKEYIDSFDLLEHENKFLEFRLKQIHKENSNINVENVLGDRVRNSKNILNGFDSDTIEDGININGCESGRDVMDGDFLYYGEKMYDQLSCIQSNNSIFSFGTYNSDNVLYSFNVHTCSNVFGCVNLRNGKYCIFNKQYTKDEYEELVPRIIKHMIQTGEYGEFLNESLSPFEYSETAAEEYYPKTKNAVALDNKPFNVTPQEVEFYKKMNIETPKKHPNIRYKERLARRNTRKLYDRNCDKCQKAINTTYSPSRKEIVYCEECYLKEVY